MQMGLEGIDASDFSFLPIVSTYARELGMVEEINRLCGRSKGVNAGQVCLALILDTLTGRSPLFRLEDSFAHLDIELLLGQRNSGDTILDCSYYRLWSRSCLAQYASGNSLQSSNEFFVPQMTPGTLMTPQEAHVLRRRVLGQALMPAVHKEGLLATTAAQHVGWGESANPIARVKPATDGVHFVYPIP